MSGVLDMTMDPWVIFDADNTLWEVESLYDDARRALTSILASRGIDSAVAEEMQQTIDEDLYKTFGYSAQRFPASFERTLTYFFPSSSDEERSAIRALAEKVFTQPVVTHAALAEVISRLETGYRLGILTAGEEWVQRSRLEQFAYRDRFQAIEVVQAKDVNAFAGFAGRHAVDCKKSWVVGDSIRSDILPAQAAGFNTILVASNNWYRVEMSSLPLQGGHSVADLGDILEIIPLSGRLRS